MTTLPIIQAPDPRLKTPARPIAPDELPDLQGLIDDMFETMYAAPGIGLAAPQIGRGLRLFVADVAKEDEPPAPLVVINPEILKVSEESLALEEGCLSLPEMYGEVTRPAGVVLRCRDRGGESREIMAEGLLARCLLHELDHLDGILFIDHLSLLKRNMILRKLAKARRHKRTGS